ncbi:MAG TPA: arsenate reductase ArsC [Sphingomonas sp.]|nr:arsenate reductase ArsC [Sphingomonas sp.]
MPDKVYNVLFLCAGNAARSVFAEAILNREGEGRFRGYSAGSSADEAIAPGALNVLARLGFETANLRPKSWDEFSTPDAPTMDFVFTVCDDTAEEACPVWPGHPVTAHWGIEDPCACVGDEDERDHAFCQALRFLENRISLFTSLPIDKLDAISLKAKVGAIGQIEGASSGAQ